MTAHAESTQGDAPPRVGARESHKAVRTSPEALSAGLARGLRNAYLVTGAEPLLIAESCDAIRERARQEGYADREVHFVERGFDWNALLADSANLSLFATRRLIELKFASAPDATAGGALAGIAFGMGGKGGSGNLQTNPAPPAQPIVIQPPTITIGKP